MSPKLLNILLATAAFALYYVVLNPLYSGSGPVWQPEQSISVLRDLNRQYDETLTQSDLLYKQAESLRIDYTKIGPDARQKMSMMVPDSIDPVRLVSEVSNIANQAGLALNDVSYAQNVSNDPLSGSYTVSFTVKTTYPLFKDLMHNYETSLRLFSIQNVSFSPPQKEGDLATFQVRLSTYYLK